MNNLTNHENFEENKSLLYYRDNIVRLSLKFNEDVNSFSEELIQIAKSTIHYRVDDVLFREILLNEAKLFERRQFLTLIKPLRALNQKNFKRQVVAEDENQTPSSLEL